MRKIIWTITALSLIAVAPAASAKASKKETIGVGAGGVIGAIAAGPLGFMIGAAIGAKIGDEFHKDSVEIDGLNASLEASNSSVDTLQADLQQRDASIDALSGELQQLESVAHPELLDLLQAGIAMDLLFRTDEHVLADTTGSRLAELAATVASMENIQVQLDGFADERGGLDYNQRLSEKRVEFVRELLIQAGVEPARISIAAHGEAPAQDDTVDSFALERRVSLTLYIDNSPSFASNPE